MTRIALAIVIATCLVACSKNEVSDSPDGQPAAATRGSDAAIPTIERAVRVWRRDRPTVDLVSSRLEGTVMARTSSQALIHYPGYRVILTTPGELVTRIEFQFDDTKPSIGQLTDLFGKPEERRDRVLFTKEWSTIGQTIDILAAPVSMPAEETTLVKGLRIEGARKTR